MGTRVFELGDLNMARSERLIPRAGANNKTSVILASERAAVPNWSWAGAHESCPSRRVEPASRAKQRWVVARPKFPAFAQCRVDTSFPAEERQTNVSPRGAPPPDVTPRGNRLRIVPGGKRGERGNYPEACTGRAFFSSMIGNVAASWAIHAR